MSKDQSGQDHYPEEWTDAARIKHLSCVCGYSSWPCPAFVPRTCKKRGHAKRVGGGNVIAEAHRMAKAGGYGFLGTSGMRSYSERLKLAISHLTPLDKNPN